MRGLTTFAPGPTVVNTGVTTIRRVPVPRREAGAGADVSLPDVSLLGGPGPRRGARVTASGAPPETELRIPVISANQVTVWAALRRLGTRAVGPYRAPTDVSARSGTPPPGRTPGSALPEEEKQQEGWS
ncbi:hypothetical protein SUDANB126_04496 [Streptomyces sp. enrichment culture]